MKCDPAALARLLTEYWSPRAVATVDDCYVKVARLLGAVGWHAHDDGDELFYVLRGALCIELEAGQVQLRRGEMYVVARGVRHNPVARAECHVLLVERKSMRHTGDLASVLTRTIDEQLRPLG